MNNALLRLARSHCVLASQHAAVWHRQEICSRESTPPFHPGSSHSCPRVVRTVATRARTPSATLWSSGVFAYPQRTLSPSTFQPSRALPSLPLVRRRCVLYSRSLLGLCLVTLSLSPSSCHLISHMRVRTCVRCLSSRNGYRLKSATFFLPAHGTAVAEYSFLLLLKRQQPLDLLCACTSNHCEDAYLWHTLCHTS